MTFHVIFPVAGVGSRFGNILPKQYVQIAGKTVMEWTLSAWTGLVDGKSIVAVAESDPYYPNVLSHFPNTEVVFGAATRAETVCNALRHLSQSASLDDWVLVHDVARLCVRSEDINKLIQHCNQSKQGGLLACKLTDTIKQQIPDQAVTTLDRDFLWAALTPQCFRLGHLLDSLSIALKQGLSVTDEASAMEMAGYSVHLIEGHNDNIKLTHADDLFMVEHILKQQGRC